MPYAFTEQGVAMLSVEFFIFFIAYLKDLGKKWFAFSKMDIGTVDMLAKLKEKK